MRPLHAYLQEATEGFLRYGSVVGLFDKVLGDLLEITAVDHLGSLGSVCIDRIA